MLCSKCGAELISDNENPSNEVTQEIENQTPAIDIVQANNNQTLPNENNQGNNPKQNNNMVFNIWFCGDKLISDNENPSNEDNQEIENQTPAIDIVQANNNQTLPNENNQGNNQKQNNNMVFNIWFHF